MSIPTISNTSTATDNRSGVRQSGTQSNTDNTNTGVGNGNVGNQGGSGQPDAVSISSRATDLQSLETSIKQLPDTDASRVSALREQINAGNYSVDSQRVADKMLAFERSL
ncbi:flagellar biosynthesis anti-sigma factor FlgM [Pseudohongiella sp.]|uniref:Negative regulator of flagellin synthesis n=1 Tax=marine sediment metagenome TaxID=412755 RepID=A0A0F9YH67_9ZZZZ|nr:flagellar biosynthesis anti-sigma factor FlgM [Pseudohongiella sp.]HDZ09160.1 flagellar biosynthesis anti-sigma factor FlgM [Pseudohongiella sp.]HEA63504.1 flagellar biosynthesis anti-sigma factor FlgM [Pseudohongiella sp.]